MMDGCQTCGQPVEVRLVQAWHGTDVLTVTLEPVPVAACAQGHAVVRVEATDVAVRVRDQVTVARRRRLARVDRCGACGADLVMPGRATQTPVPIIVDGEVVTVLLECVMIRCPECGREQVPSEVDAILADVVAAALADAVA